MPANASPPRSSGRAAHYSTRWVQDQTRATGGKTRPRRMGGTRPRDPAAEGPRGVFHVAIDAPAAPRVPQRRHTHTARLRFASTRSVIVTQGKHARSRSQGNARLPHTAQRRVPQAPPAAHRISGS